MAATLAATFLLASCAKRSGHGYMLGLYGSEDPAIFATTLSEFRAWLAASGLQPVPSPGGTAEWAGTHAEGERNAWYALAIGRHQVLLCITITAHGGYGQIDACTNYDGDFTAGELADVRRRNHRLWLEIIAWFEAHAPENAMTEPAKDWFGKARRDIGDAYIEKGEQP